MNRSICVHQMPADDCIQCLRGMLPRDVVGCPPHYTQGAVECIDAMRAAFGEEAVRAHCLCNAFKYVWRANEKGAADQDVRKAIWYLRFAIGDDPRAGTRTHASARAV